MPVNQVAHDLRGVSCTDRVKTGLMMGFMIGATLGGVYGGANAFRAGLGGGEVARLVGKNMLNLGASFAGFMSIGTLLRC